MKIPNFLNEKVVDKNGYFTEEWAHIFNQLFNELQTQMSDEGHIMPSQPTTNILQLNDPTYTGAIIYNETTQKMNANINGIFKEILTT